VKIKSVTLSALEEGLDERIKAIFTQLGAKEKQHNGQSVLSMTTTPDIMAKKMEIAQDHLARLGYNQSSKSIQHFWYFSDKRKKLDKISVESQGEIGFVQERQEYLIWW
jgi:hypothetical protein